MQAFIIFIGIAIICTACQPLLSEDETVQMEADLSFYATEAVQVREAMLIEVTAAAATIAAAEREAAEYAALNRALAATRSAVIPATRSVVVIDNSSGPMPLEMFDLSDGQMRFVQIGVAGTINASDDCWVTHQTFFDEMTTQVIYLVALGLNLQSNTTVIGEWVYEGDIVHQNTWTAPEATRGRCIALPLRQSDAPLAPGNWIARFRVNGQVLDPAPFTITG